MHQREVITIDLIGKKGYSIIYITTTSAKRTASTAVSSTTTSAPIRFRVAIRIVLHGLQDRQACRRAKYQSRDDKTLKTRRFIGSEFQYDDRGFI